MDTGSPSLPEIARKSETLILQRLASVGQARLAEALGISESTVSRWKDGDLAKTAQTLAVLGLRVVPVTDRTIAPDKVAALIALAEGGFNELRRELAS